MMRIVCFLLIPIVQYFKSNNIIVYAVPPLSSETFQPLDTIFFSAFKNISLQNIATESVSVTEKKPLHLFDFYGLWNVTIRRSFRKTVIVVGFRMSGVWTMDSRRFIYTLRPRCNAASDTTIFSTAKRTYFFMSKF